MANKLVKRKPVLDESAAIKTEPKQPLVTNDEPVSNASDVLAAEKEVFNAETAQVLREADAGKNLTRYVDEDDLFRKLGIKIDKA